MARRAIRKKLRGWWPTALILLAACAQTTRPQGDTGLEREVLVSAAASLSEAFAEIEAAFEAAHPGVDVVANLGASSTLREQILQGAPIDVFASANIANMDQVVSAGMTAGEPAVFATNLLQIAVPAGNPGDIAGLEDFARSELLIGLCVAEAPCGAFARQALASAGVVASVDTNEANVRALLVKIELGELDAGITYVTDVLSAGGTVAGVPIPDEHNIVAEYPIVVLADAPHPSAAAAFVAFVLSTEGQAILGEYGFSSP